MILFINGIRLNTNKLSVGYFHWPGTWMPAVDIFNFFSWLKLAATYFLGGNFNKFVYLL